MRRGQRSEPGCIPWPYVQIPDALMWRYFELLTRLPDAELGPLLAGHPMGAKRRLASTITAQY